MPADETQLLYSLCLHGRAELGLAPDEYAALTMVLLRLLAFKPATGQVLVAEKKTLNKPVSPVPQAAAVPKPLLSSPPASPLPEAPRVARLQAWDEEPNRPLEHAQQAPAAIEKIAKPAMPEMPPPGQQLPVIAMAESGGSMPAVAPPQVDATQLAAIPVRIQADSRTEAAAGQAAASVLLPSEEGEFWHLAVQQLIAAEAITALVRELALQSQLVARDTDQWVLRVERESLNQSGTRERLAAALQANGHAVGLAVEIGRVTDSPARRNAALAAERQLVAEKIIFDDPFVQRMMQDFGAKIVPGSIKPG